MPHVSLGAGHPSEVSSETVSTVELIPVSSPSILDINLQYSHDTPKPQNHIINHTKHQKCPPTDPPSSSPTATPKDTQTTPHARLLQLLGVGSRRPDGTFAGASIAADGTLTFNIREQTAAILENIERVIKHATDDKGGLENVTDAMVFMVDLRGDYERMNEVWNETWTEAQGAPARTTIGVRELPSAEMIVEVKCTAVVEVDG